MSEQKQEQMRRIAEQGNARRQAKKAAKQQQEQNMSAQRQEQMRRMQEQSRPKKRAEEPSMIASMFQDVAALPATAVNVAASIPATAIGGLAGMVSAPFVGVDKAVENQKAVQAALTPTPNATSQRQLEGLGNMLETPINAYEGFKQDMGDAAFEATGSPAVATAFFTAPDAAIELLGAGALTRTARASKYAKDATKAKAAEDLLDPVKRLETKEAATHTVNAKGEVVPDRIGTQLVQDGVRDADAALVTNSNLATRTTMARMKKAKQDYEAGRTRSDSSQQIVGQETARVAAKLNNRRKGLGTQLDNVVKSNGLGKTELDASPALSQFGQDIAGLGVKKKPDFDTGMEVLDFDGSSLDFSTLGNARTVLEDAYKMIQQGGAHSLADLHKLKRNLNQLLDSGKLEAGGSLGDVERIVANLNRNLNEVMNTVPEYAAVNSKLAKTYDALSYFNDYRPAGVGWDSPKVANGMAGVVDKSMTNGTPLLNLREGLRLASREMAESKPLSVDVDALLNWHQDMGGLFKITEQSVLDAMERISQSQRQAIGGAGASAAVGNTFGLVHDTAKLVANGAKKSEAKAALERLRRVEANVDAALSRTTVRTQ